MTNNGEVEFTFDTIFPGEIRTVTGKVSEDHYTGLTTPDNALDVVATTGDDGSETLFRINTDTDVVRVIPPTHGEFEKYSHVVGDVTDLKHVVES